MILDLKYCSQYHIKAISISCTTPKAAHLSPVAGFLDNSDRIDLPTWYLLPPFQWLLLSLNMPREVSFPAYQWSPSHLGRGAFLLFLKKWTIHLWPETKASIHDCPSCCKRAVCSSLHLLPPAGLHPPPPAWSSPSRCWWGTGKCPLCRNYLPGEVVCIPSVDKYRSWKKKDKISPGINGQPCVV